MLCMNLILRCQMRMILNEIVWMNAQTISVMHAIFNAYPRLINEGRYFNCFRIVLVILPLLSVRYCYFEERYFN